MANYDWRTGQYAIDPKGNGNFNWSQEGLKGQEWCVTRYFDTAAINMGTGDTWKVITIDAGVLITGAWATVVTAEGGTLTMDIGDSSSGTAFHSNLNGNSAVATALTLQTKYYASADYVVIAMDNAADAAQFYITLRGVRLT